MATIAFLGNRETPKFNLKLWSRMTPGRSGVWGNLTGIDDPLIADYVVALDSYDLSLPHDWIRDYSKAQLASIVDVEKLILLGAHPESNRYYTNMDLEPDNCCRRIDIGKTMGFGEWWIKHDYDYLSALQPVEKTKKIGAIVSDANTTDYHAKRLAWLERFCQKHLKKLDIYGTIAATDAMYPNYKGVCGQRGVDADGYMTGKADVYEKYECMIEFDATGEHYFSERVYDCLLMYCFMFYWGGGGVKKYFPQGCHFLFDIDGEGDDVLAEISRPDFYARRLPAIQEARHMLLNKYHLWPRIHRELYGEFS